MGYEGNLFFKSTFHICKNTKTKEKQFFLINLLTRASTNFTIYCHNELNTYFIFFTFLQWERCIFIVLCSFGTDIFGIENSYLHKNAFLHRSFLPNSKTDFSSSCSLHGIFKAHVGHSSSHFWGTLGFITRKIY